METKAQEITPEAAPEKTIFDAIGQEDLAEFTRILSEHKGGVNFFDENGMTALQHAAYKGNKEMVQLLLDRVNIIVIFCLFQIIFLANYNIVKQFTIMILYF